MDYTATQIDTMRGALRERWTFLHIATALIPDLVSKPYIPNLNKELGEWIDTSDEAELKIRGDLVAGQLDAIINLVTKRLPLKTTFSEIAADHWEKCNSKEFSFETGVRCGWIAERFDHSALNIPDDMPYHARIGVGIHAGNAAIEEDFLLRDAYFMLAQCKASLISLEGLGIELKAKGELSKIDYKHISKLNQNVATFGRFSVFGFYSFVECFVDSVGEDFIQRNLARLSPDECEILRGKKDGRHISTERKIEVFPGLIRTDKKRPLVISDRKQISEPFKSFIYDVKEIRDAASHFSAHKAAIVISPQNWARRAEDAAATCMAVAREFWLACYPLRNLPLYLGELNDARHIMIAESRIAT